MRSEREVLINCVQRLNASQIPYMLTDSMASNAWGMARSTHDIDIVMHFSPTDVATVVQAFTPGFFIQEMSVRNALRPPYQFKAINEQSPLKVDIWVLRPEPFEREMFRRRVVIDYDSVPISIATAEDVLLHKLYWNKLSPSERQLGDAAGIFAVQSDQLDMKYLRHWANELGVSEVLEQILNGTIRPKST